MVKISQKLIQKIELNNKVMPLYSNYDKHAAKRL